MKNKLIFLLLFLKTLSLGATAPDLQTYKNTRYGFELQYPKTWTINAGDDWYEEESLTETHSLTLTKIQPTEDRLDIYAFRGDATPQKYQDHIDEFSERQKAEDKNPERSRRHQTLELNGNKVELLASISLNVKPQNDTRSVSAVATVFCPKSFRIISFGTHKRRPISKNIVEDTSQPFTLESAFSDTEAAIIRSFKCPPAIAEKDIKRAKEGYRFYQNFLGYEIQYPQNFQIGSSNAGKVQSKSDGIFIRNVCFTQKVTPSNGSCSLRVTPAAFIFNDRSKFEKEQIHSADQIRKRVPELKFAKHYAYTENPQKQQYGFYTSYDEKTISAYVDQYCRNDLSRYRLTFEFNPEKQTLTEFFDPEKEQIIPEPQKSMLESFKCAPAATPIVDKNYGYAEAVYKSEPYGFEFNYPANYWTVDFTDSLTTKDDLPVEDAAKIYFYSQDFSKTVCRQDCQNEFKIFRTEGAAEGYNKIEKEITRLYKEPIQKAMFRAAKPSELIKNKKADLLFEEIKSEFQKDMKTHIFLYCEPAKRIFKFSFLSDHEKTSKLYQQTNGPIRLEDILSAVQQRFIQTLQCPVSAVEPKPRPISQNKEKTLDESTGISFEYPDSFEVQHEDSWKVFDYNSEDNSKNRIFWDIHDVKIEQNERQLQDRVNTRVGMMFASDGPTSYTVGAAAFLETLTTATNNKAQLFELRVKVIEGDKQPNPPYKRGYFLAVDLRSSNLHRGVTLYIYSPTKEVLYEVARSIKIPER